MKNAGGVEYDINVLGFTTSMDRQQILSRASAMLMHHPTLLAGRELAFKYNGIRITLIPHKEKDSESNSV